MFICTFLSSICGWDDDDDDDDDNTDVIFILFYFISICNIITLVEYLAPPYDQNMESL